METYEFLKNVLLIKIFESGLKYRAHNYTENLKHFTIEKIFNEIQ